MMKLVPISLLILLAATAASAQVVQPGSDLVLFGGGASSSFTGSDKALLGDGTRTGTTAGLGYVLRVNPDFGFEVDVRMTQKGGEGTIDITDYTGANNGPTIVGEGTTRLTYLEIPLMLAVQLGISKSSHLRAYGGPSINILVSANFEGVIQGQEQKVDINEGIKGNEVGLALGGGWTYDAGKASLWVDGRWSFGLASISDTSKDRDIKNQSWEFALGVGVPLSRE